MSRALARCQKDRGMMLDPTASATKPPSHGVTESQPAGGDTASWWSVADNLWLGCPTPRAAAFIDNVPDCKM
ncbi:hypothetical protein D7B24_004480 [Verticillium nonalfalfae]|uniref:Uncharacterized protein n=1 Tax=Verticillium nonalfalfae TaxID=1051616 RepID=A0A3M9YDR8_9PEZI|nr:uncharacterized protein D7B24_004480 [Verticillium nonalfalfae]RNJ58609.1 hypothetical protein D7B24_004480 [Verticillium nonalfalfae]